MSAIIPFTADAQLPAYLKNRTGLADINADVVTAAAYPTMSIKGKKFTLVRDGLRTTLMKPPPDEDEPLQKLEIAVLRANMHTRVFYMAKYNEADESNAPPDCFTMDGVKPVNGVPNKQSDQCATCPHSVWGTGNTEKGTGRACSDTPRLAIAAPDKLEEPYLLRVPPASIKNWKEAVKIAKTRNIPYNALVYRLGFDNDKDGIVLTFRPVGLLSDDAYGTVNKGYDGEMVRAICGLDEPAVAPAAAPAPAPAVDTSELDAAIAAKAATTRAASAAKAKPAVSEKELDVAAPPPKPAAKPKAEAAPAPAPAANPAKDDAGTDDLLAGLDTLLGTPDD